MKKTLLIISACIVAISWYSCQYKKEAIAYPVSTCDTSVVRFSVEIRSILQANCYICHAAAVANAAGGGYNYETYAGITPNVANGKLLRSIMQVPGSDFMPKNAAKLSDCDIAKFRTWIRNGYPNN
jgi:cytochrome c5